MAKYKAFYNRSSCIVVAATSLEAQQEAARRLGVTERNRHKIAVVLIGDE